MTYILEGSYLYEGTFSEPIRSGLMANRNASLPKQLVIVIVFKKRLTVRKFVCCGTQQFVALG